VSSVTSRRIIRLQPIRAEVNHSRACIGEVASQAGFSTERIVDILAAALEAARAALERAQGQGEVTLLIVTSHSFLEVQVTGPGEVRQPLPGHKPLRGLELPLMAALTDELTIRSRNDCTSVTLGFKRDKAESQD
jgi:anti-sigma regulatory factor (Ser/Thr protein kinase)